ncbi:DeoR family fructose operon transcriptional repressor [Enterococcus sp. PF1-24]|uniref:DeoR/GlpR family DNA-binding transcription regulator n=1 Tax=unclassified Enterococcus TaxID=2608891 RepID=UPI0024738519|nr:MULTISPECIES: DeoR/GlpR family DNA-binding transcription regulator [unclassified Enterococcus]MDH6364012.1 DeoR family fructose operon transcriptional repressor [Enterococcus sp. PFB1-1]MDH6401113.1 DeoR family fructose operon transcriptional repressor [Enterococcus sp. PF1-24]
MDENKFMYAEERKAKILRLLEEQERLQVVDLVELFQVSGSTIRTDMRELEKEHLLTRTHGGAIRNLQRSFEDKPKVRTLTDEKRKIARKAVDLLNDGDSLVIDTGTSCLAFAEALINSSVKDLRILTYDLQIASMLSEETNHEICFIGGIIRNGFQYASGEMVIESLRTFLVDKAVIGTTSFSPEKGYSTPNIGTAELKKVLFTIAKEKLLLCESSKIRKDSFKLFARPNEVDLFITDNEITDEKLKELKRLNLSVSIA